jgi:hypothetical protein
LPPGSIHRTHSPCQTVSASRSVTPTPRQLGQTEVPAQKQGELSTPAIMGITIAAIALIVLVVAVIFCVRRSNRNRVLLDSDNPGYDYTLSL